MERKWYISAVMMIMGLILADAVVAAAKSLCIPAARAEVESKSLAVNV